MINGPSLVIAGPGTGKTTFLVKECLEIIKSENFKGIILCTFTNKSANELKKRLESQISINDNRILIGTIHSICYELLKQFSNSTNFEIIPDERLISFIYSRLSNLGFSSDVIKKSGWSLAEEMEQIFSLLTEFSVDLEKIDFESEALEDICKVYPTYKRILERNGLVDFATLQEKILSQLKENKKFKDDLLANFDYFFIDEYQDTNDIQNQIFYEICFPDKNLVVVGDDDQSIYSFRGANSDHIINFTKVYKNAKVSRLFDNFRSTINIVNASNKLISFSPFPRLEKEITSARKIFGPPVTIEEFEDDHEEIDFIVEQINKIKATQNYEFSDFVILMRSIKNYAPLITKIFNQNNIPFQFYGLGNLFENSFSREFIALIDYVISSNSDRNEKLTIELTEIDKSYGTNTLAFHLQNSTTEKLDEININNIKSCISLTYQIFVISEYITRYEIYGVDLGTLTQLALSFDTFNTSFNPFIYFSYLKYLKKNLQVSSDYRVENAVNVMTIHQSKGLEFPVVFLSNQNEYKKINNSVQKLREKVRAINTFEDEDRRLFYVAMTRAENYLFITSSKEKDFAKKEYISNTFFTELSNFKSEYDNAAIAKRKNKSLSNETLLLSFNQIKTYLICPKMYQFSNVYKLQTVKIGGLDYGLNMHRIVEVILRLKKDNIFDSQDLEDLFDDTWIPSVFRSPSENRKYRKIAFEQIKDFLVNFDSFFSSYTVTAIEEPFNNKINDNLNLIGRVDAIFSNGEKSVIVDFKTGDSVDYDDQLILYKFCLDKKYNRNFESAIYSFNSGNIKNFVFSEADKDNFLKRTSEVATNILNSNFIANPGKYCSDCAFRQICPYK